MADGNGTQAEAVDGLWVAEDALGNQEAPTVMRKVVRHAIAQHH